MRKAPIIIISPTMAFLIPSKACPTSPGLELVIYLKPEATNTATVIAPSIPKRALIIPAMRAVILLNLLGFINPTVCGELASVVVPLSVVFPGVAAFAVHVGLGGVP
jgi:hypothetical protein